MRTQLVRTARGRAGAPLRWGYTAVSAIEIAGATAFARMRRRPHRSVDDLTVIAKTFERPRNARRMVKTLRRVFDGVIVVAGKDKNKHNNKNWNNKNWNNKRSWWSGPIGNGTGVPITAP